MSSIPSADAKAVVRAIEAMTTQVAQAIAKASSAAQTDYALTPTPLDDASTTPDQSVYCPLCVDAPRLLTPTDADHHFRTKHPEQQLVGTGPWPMLATDDGPTTGANRVPCPYCVAPTMIPSTLITDHIARLHNVGLATYGPYPTAADDAVCRVMETRTCPPSYNGPCGDRPCARFESEDPAPWLDTAETTAADEDRQRQARRDSIGMLLGALDRSMLIATEKAALRQHVEAEMREADKVRAWLMSLARKSGQLIAGRRTWKAKAEEMERARDEEERLRLALAAERTRWKDRAEAAEAEAERLRDLVTAENKRADEAINREDTAELAYEEQRGRAAAAAATIERVRDALKVWSATALPRSEAHQVLADVRHALDGTEQSSTEAQRMTEPEPVAPVVLTVEINIDGLTYVQRQSLPRREWEAIERDPKLRPTVENMLRARLGATVMEQLQPPVTVHMPTELDEAVMQRAVEEADFVDQHTNPDIIGTTEGP